MMELTCAFILISASLVSATPHGYGVKGGASARAESSASAGAFGGVAGEIPVAVPLGTGYSGSFSKSSSSSSSSSSASSSSSSSSFSYSNSGVGGFGLSGGGCSSGNCQPAGGNGIPAPHGSSAHGYNSANAAATVGAGAVSGSGCQGQSCDNHSEKCAPGQCTPKPQTGTTSIDSDSNKCTSGQCGSDLKNGASPTEYGPNDIRVVTDASDSAHNANDQSSSIDKTSSAYNGAGSDCSQGKCGASVPLSSKPNYYSYDSGNSYQGTSASNKHQVSSSDTGITSQYQKPSTHLETPKLGSTCNSGNCNAESDEPGNETSPSSYNVPIHGEYDRGEQKPSCDGVKCENGPKGTYSSTNSNSLSTIFLNPQHSLSTENSVTPPGPSSFDNPSPTNCGGSSCFGIPANQFTGKPKPGDINFGHKSTNAPTSSVTNCKYPNCSPYPTNPTGSNIAPGYIGNGKPSDVNKPSNDKLPVYTGGFGGPSGVLNPNEFDVTVPTGNPSHGHASTSQNGKPLGSVPTSCNSPSCSGYPSASGPSVPTGTYNNKPGGEVSSEKLPLYTGGFGGPAGMLKPSEFNLHVIPTNRPTIGSPACSLGNCASATSGTAAPSGNYSPTKPSAGISSPSEKLPTYNGGFSGPGVVFNPNELNVAAPTGNPSHAHASTSQNEKPFVSVPTSCNSPSCSGYPSASGPNVPTGTYNIKPGGEVPGEKSPTYTGGFGGPTGMLKPNKFDDHAIPQNAHRPTIGLATACLLGNCGITSGTIAPSGYFGTTKPSIGINSPSGPGVFNPDKYDVHAISPSSPGHTSSDHPAGCKTPNCYPSLGSTAAANAQAESFGISNPSSGPHLSSVTVPAYPSGYDKPSEVHRPNEISAPGLTPSFTNTQSPSSPGSYSTGCKTGNCAYYPTSRPSADANAQPGSFGITKPNTNVNPASSTLPQYTGFSGPSGTLKPNEHTYVTPSTVSAPINCGTPNCVNSPTVGGDAISAANAQSASFGITKPSSDNNLSNEKPIYFGGFGGPTGLLKPNEHIAPAVNPTPNSYNKPSGVSTPTACTSGNCNIHVPGSTPLSHNDASTGLHVTAAATADANAVAYSGGFGGPPGVLEPYDDGKIGISHTNGGQAHGSQTGSAHYSSHNANIHSSHGTIPGANSGPTGPAGLGAHEYTGAPAGSTAGSTANAGTAVGAFAGAHGYSLHGSHYSQAGNIKGGSPCGGGCGGTSGGNYNGAAAKSLAGASAFGVGGSYASSSASAHASAGAYTKGGYGKR